MTGGHNSRRAAKAAAAGSQVLAPDPLTLSRSAWPQAKADTGSVGRRANKFDAGAKRDVRQAPNPSRH
jgi:hypothetical protein